MLQLLMIFMFAGLCVTAINMMNEKAVRENKLKRIRDKLDKLEAKEKEKKDAN